MSLVLQSQLMDRFIRWISEMNGQRPFRICFGSQDELQQIQKTSIKAKIMEMKKKEKKNSISNIYM